MTARCGSSRSTRSGWDCRAGGSERAPGRRRGQQRRSRTQVLDGDIGPHRDIVVLNAAAGLVVAGRSATIADGIEEATAAIDDGRAAAALERLVKESNRTSCPRCKSQTCNLPGGPSPVRFRHHGLGQEHHGPADPPEPLRPRAEGSVCTRARPAGRPGLERLGVSAPAVDVETPARSLRAGLRPCPCPRHHRLPRVRRGPVLRAEQVDAARTRRRPARRRCPRPSGCSPTSVPPVPRQRPVHGAGGRAPRAAGQGRAAGAAAGPR